MFIEDYRHCS